MDVIFNYKSKITKILTIYYKYDNKIIILEGKHYGTNNELCGWSNRLF